MREDNIQPKKKPDCSCHVDILLVQGKQGGFENELNINASYLVAHGCDVRYIQLFSTGTDWSPDGASFVCLDLDRSVFDYDAERGAYAAFLKESPGKPDVILASGWPVTVYIAKGASSDAAVHVPVVSWLHGDIHFYEESGCGGFDVLQFADLFFATNLSIAKDCYQTYPEKPVYLVQNAIRPDTVHYTEQRNTRKLVYVGRLSEEKVVAMILYALERTKIPWELFIIGEGPEEAALKSLSKELHLTNRVHFTGWQAHPMQAVPDARALIVSSLYEGGPLCALEALASGMQVISTPVGFVPELVTDDTLGYIVPFGDPDALAGAMDKLAAHPFTPETACACSAVAAPFATKAPLYDFYRKVIATAQGNILPQRYLPDNDNLLVTD